MGFDETFRQLDQLLQADATRKVRDLARLAEAVKGLDGSFLPADEPPQRDDRERRRGVTAPAPVVPLPLRGLNEAIVGRLIKEAMGRV